MLDVQKIWITPSDVWIRTADGREACEHFADYKDMFTKGETSGE